MMSILDCDLHVFWLWLSNFFASKSRKCPSILSVNYCRSVAPHESHTISFPLAFRPQIMAHGIAWPIDPKSGKASSTKIGKSVWIDVLTSLGTPAAHELAASIQKEKNWRANYMSYIVTLVEEQAAASPEACLASCRVGLEVSDEAAGGRQLSAWGHHELKAYSSSFICFPAEAQRFHDLGLCGWCCDWHRC